MATIKYATFNVNGLNNDLKRSLVFSKIKNMGMDVVLLQETHIMFGKIEKVKQECGVKSYWNPGPSSSSGGTATLILNPNIRSSDVKMDDDGRIITLKLKVETTFIQVINIYAPTQLNEREDFFNSINQFTFNTSHTILAGDFNMVEDLSLDKYPPSTDQRSQKGIKTLSNLKSQFTLDDRWRTKNPQTKQFTWHSRKVGDAFRSRLDRVYLSKGMVLIQQKSTHDVNSDHEIVQFTIQVPIKSKRGPGHWKMNVSILEEEEYIDLITSKLVENQNKDKSDLTQWWENTKLMIKYTTQSYCQERATKIKREKQNLMKQYNKPRNAALKEKIQDQINDIQRLQDRGILVRSRENTILNEDKPTGYFYMTENIKQTNGTITELHTVDENGKTTKHIDEKSVMKVIYDRHKSLYAKRPTTDFGKEMRQHFINNINLKLTPEQRRMMDAPILAAEVIRAIMEMENNKSPGPDGIPVEFYKKFIDLLIDDLVQLMCGILINHQKQPQSHKLGYIKLIHKRDEKYFIINWRGITLLCVDHKIMTKVMASRLRTVLPSIMNNDQTCSVPGRTIFQNLYLTRDVIAYSNYKRIPTYIVSYDVRNAFDSVDHGYMLEVLEAFNFGPNYLNFIKEIYSNRFVQVMNNGYYSLDIPLARGVTQGGPQSQQIFCLTMEPLANEIRRTTSIIGYPIPHSEEEVKLSQYADDTESITTDKRSILTTQNIFTAFEPASGYGLHPGKTKGMSIMTDDIPELPANIKWNDPNGMKIRGINFFRDPQRTIASNWTKALKEVETAMLMQKYRILSLKGKVMILNSKILSKVWYLSTVFPIPDKDKVNLEFSLFEFLWDYKSGPEPIKRIVIHMPKEEGGLGLINLRTQGEALRLKYFFEIPRQIVTHKWVYFARYWIGNRIVKFNEEWTHLRDNTTPSYNLLYRKNVPHHYRILLEDANKSCKEILKLDDITTKGIYTIIRKNIPKPEITAETTWSNKHYLRRITLNWKKLWKHQYRSYCVGKPNDTLYKVMHNALPTKAKIKRNRSKTSNKTVPYDAKCCLCEKSDETLMHLFAQCKFSQEIWKSYKDVFKKLLPTIPFVYEHVTLTINLLTVKDKNISKLILTLTTYILYEIWLTRNKCMKENVKPNVDRSTRAINKNVNDILKAHYKYHKVRKSLHIFRTKFTINNVLCTLDYHNKLNLNLPP